MRTMELASFQCEMWQRSDNLHESSTTNSIQAHFFFNWIFTCDSNLMMRYYPFNWALVQLFDMKKKIDKRRLMQKVHTWTLVTFLTNDWYFEVHSNSDAMYYIIIYFLHSFLNCKCYSVKAKKRQSNRFIFNKAIDLGNLVNFNRLVFIASKLVFSKMKDLLFSLMSRIRCVHWLKCELPESISSIR